MKKVQALLLVFCLLLTFTACNQQEGASSAPTQENNASHSENEPVAPTFSVQGVEFYPILLPEDLFAANEVGVDPTPGEYDTAVAEIKTLLRESFLETDMEFVAYSQTRPEVGDLFDSHLEALVNTLYLFTGMEQEPCLDQMTISLLSALPQLPLGMQKDVYTVYKAAMIDAGIDGTVLRGGSSPGVYYTAQTDPDWADYPFPNAAYEPEAADTIRDRACGVMSMTMVGSTYLHRELDPTMLVDYVLENGWRIAASGVDDTFMQEAARLLELPQPDIYYQAPAEGQQPIDWEQVQQVVGNGGMAIVHETRGNFTPAQHYIVLCDYVEQDGTGYFLVSDPYQSRRRYYQWDTDMADPGLGEEGVVLATPQLVAQTSSAVILFEQEQDQWDLVCRSAAPFELSADMIL